MSALYQLIATCLFTTLNFSSDKPNLGTPIDGEKCTGGQPKYQMNDMEIYELP